MNTATARIIDANTNRIREGLRVVEEYARFDLNDAGITGKLKSIRHDLARQLDAFDTPRLLRARDSHRDVGRHGETSSEYTRNSSADVAMASIKRIQEGLRVIEEYAKTIGPEVARDIEQLRYRCYEIEQAISIRVTACQRFRGVRLYVIITESLCSRDWLEIAGSALAGGADCLQLREKNLPARELVGRSRTLAQLCHDHGALMILNDRPDIAVLAGADGVHVGQDDLTVPDVRRIAGLDLLVGLSTHNTDQLRDAINISPDYIAVGPMFPSSTKPQDHVPGLPLAAYAAEHTSLPIVPIGGINASNLDQLVGGGITRICVCSAIISADDVRQATVNLKTALNRAVSDSTDPVPTGSA